VADWDWPWGWLRTCKKVARFKRFDSASDGKARDNDVSFKKLKITLNESDPATRKIIPIEYKHGLFVVRFALLFAASVAPANSKKE
jgi:hypothetical protein